VVQLTTVSTILITACRTLLFAAVLLLGTLWLVADFEAIPYQGTMNLIRAKALKLALQRQLTIPHVCALHEQRAPVVSC
jgi:hypothetical protein